MTDSPLALLILFAVGAYVTKLWWADYRAALTGTPNPGELPGARRASRGVVIVAVLGAILIVLLETWGEIRLGLSAEQSEITVLFGCYTLLAAIVEEVIFRGFVVAKESKGRIVLWASIFGASLVFAAFHPFLWEWEDEGWQWTFTPKGWFSTAAVFVSSLWFYTVRFLPANKDRSLIPCFAAHMAKNAMVFAVKGAQGFVVGWW